MRGYGKRKLVLSLIRSKNGFNSKQKSLCHHPCRSLFYGRDHLRSNMGIISGPGSFEVQFGDHLRSGIVCGPGIICGAVQFGI